MEYFRAISINAVQPASSIDATIDLALVDCLELCIVHCTSVGVFLV